MADIVKHAQAALDAAADLNRSLNRGAAPSGAQFSAAQAAGAALRSAVDVVLAAPGDLSFTFQDAAQAAKLASSSFETSMRIIQETDVGTPFGAAQASSAVAAYSRQLEPVVGGLTDDPCVYPREFGRDVGVAATSVSDGIRACGREVYHQQMPLSLEAIYGPTPMSLFADGESHPCGVYGAGPTGNGAGSSCPTHSEANAAADTALVEDFPKPTYAGQDFVPWEHA